MNAARAQEIVSRYPRPRNALLPLLWQAQEEDGYVNAAAMREIAAIIGISPAEVYGTASFYTMFKLEPTGRYLVSVCRGVSCMWLGSEHITDRLVAALGIRPGQTTADGVFTLEEAECLAACGGAPCLQVNYLFAERVTPEQVDEMVDDLLAGRHPWMVQDALPVGSHPGEALFG